MAKLTREATAEVQIRIAAYLMYIVDQPHPHDYIVLSVIKYLKYLQWKVDRSRLIAILGTEEQCLDEILTRMREEGWIAEEDGHIVPRGRGDVELSKIMGHLSKVIYNIKQEAETTRWTKRSMKSKK